MPKEEVDKPKAKDDEPIKAVKSTPPWPLITVGVVGSIVLLAIIVGVWWAVAMHHAKQRMTGFRRSGQSDQQVPLYSRHGMRGGRMMAAARGVVTAVNNDSITVSGYGKEVTIKRDSNTTVTGDKTDVAVNDTVTVYGRTNSDGSVVASRIVVRNQVAGAASEGSVNSTTPGV